MTNPPYDPDPTNPSQPGTGAAADPFSPGAASSAPGSYSSDPYPASGPVVTEDYAAGGYVGTTDSGAGSTKDVAKDEAAKTKDTAVDAGKSVASTAKGEASNVVAEAKGQAQSLVGTVTSEVRGQVSTQQQRLAGGIHSLASELGSMASKSEQAGPASDLTKQASQKVGQVAHWLESKEPADLLNDLKAFARRRPGLFLGLSALAGAVVGRVGRGAVAANTKLDSPESSTPSSYGTPPSYGAPSTYTTPTTYDTGYTGGTSSYEGTTTGAPASMVEELPTSYEGTSDDYSITADRDAGRGDVIR